MPETVNSSEVLNAPVLQYAIYVKGQYDTLADLQAAHPTGEEGDAYNVGEMLYMWDESSQAWAPAGSSLVQLSFIEEKFFSASKAIGALIAPAQAGQVIVATGTGYEWQDAQTALKGEA